MTTRDETKTYKPEGSMKLDDPTLRARAATLPPETREPFVWLGIYLRESCQRYTRVLAARIVELGLEGDAEKLSAILRGHWFVNPNGLTRPEPVMSVPEFLKIVEVLKKSAAKAMRGAIPFVHTSTARRILDEVETARSRGWTNRFVVVIGETGGQKSTTFNHLVRTTPNGECVRMEALGSGYVQFLADFDRCFGGHSQNSSWRRIDHIRNALSAPTTTGKARVVIFDNAQRFVDSKRGGDQKILNFILKLQEELDFVVVFSFTPGSYTELESGRVSDYLEQIVGRAGGDDSFVRLPEFAPVEDLVLIAREFGFTEAATPANKKILQTISRRKGRIRTFIDVMQRAQALAQAEKSPLGIEHIEAVESRRVKEEGK